MTLILKQSTSIDIRMGPFVDAANGVTPEIGITLAGADQAEVLKANGELTVAMAGNFTAVTGADGWYDYTVAAGDVDTIGEVVFVVQDSSVCLPVMVRAQVVEEAIYDTLFASTADISNEIIDGVWNEDIADHVAAGTFGEALYLNAYAGDNGPGVYIDDGSGNSSVIAGEDGTPGKPVADFATAKTIADAIGIKQYYLIACDLTLAATHNDWRFTGLGAKDANIVNLGSQIVDRCVFENMSVEGTQGGTGRFTARDCVLQNDGTGTTILHVHALNCGLPSSDPGIRLTNNNDHIFEDCYSMVPGSGTPMVDADGGGSVGLNFRHYSGGIEIKDLGSTATCSVETDGQVVFNTTNNVNASVSLRGNMTVTDNTAGMTSLNDDAVYNVNQAMGANVLSISGSTVAADNLEASALGIVPGACVGTPSQTSIDTDLTETTDNHYVGRVIVFTSGNAAGEATDITGYTGSTKTLTVTALITAPLATDTFVIV